MILKLAKQLCYKNRKRGIKLESLYQPSTFYLKQGFSLTPPQPLAQPGADAARYSQARDQLKSRMPHINKKLIVALQEINSLLVGRDQPIPIHGTVGTLFTEYIMLINEQMKYLVDQVEYFCGLISGPGDGIRGAPIKSPYNTRFLADNDPHEDLFLDAAMRKKWEGSGGERADTDSSDSSATAPPPPWPKSAPARQSRLGGGGNPIPVPTTSTDSDSSSAGGAGQDSDESSSDEGLDSSWLRSSSSDSAEDEESEDEESEEEGLDSRWLRSSSSAESEPETETETETETGEEGEGDDTPQAPDGFYSSPMQRALVGDDDYEHPTAPGAPARRVPPAGWLEQFERQRQGRLHVPNAKALWRFPARTNPSDGLDLPGPPGPRDAAKSGNDKFKAQFHVFLEIIDDIIILYDNDKGEHWTLIGTPQKRAACSSAARGPDEPLGRSDGSDEMGVFRRGERRKQNYDPKLQGTYDPFVTIKSFGDTLCKDFTDFMGGARRARPDTDKLAQFKKKKYDEIDRLFAQKERIAHTADHDNPRGGGDHIRGGEGHPFIGESTREKPGHELAADRVDRQECGGGGGAEGLSPTEEMRVYGIPMVWEANLAAMNRGENIQSYRQGLGREWPPLKGSLGWVPKESPVVGRQGGGGREFEAFSDALTLS
jgi:hypothetical protein